MILLYVIAGLLLLLVILALLAPRDYQVERSTIIDQSRPEVFNYLRFLKNQDEWSPWSMKDPEMKSELRGTDGEVGAISAWDGNKDVGAGEQEILSIRENERIDSELRFFKPWRSTSDAYMITEDYDHGQTKVRWGFKGKTPIPFNILMLFMNMDKMVGKDFEEGLENLKSKLGS